MAPTKLADVFNFSIIDVVVMTIISYAYTMSLAKTFASRVSVNMRGGYGMVWYATILFDAAIYVFIVRK